MNSLKDKVAFITGAASKRGMERAIALRLAGEGADIVVVDKFSAPQSHFPGDEGWGGLNAVVAEVKSLGKEALAIVADTNNSKEVETSVAKALERFGRIDILVHCAAIRGPVTIPIIDLAEEDWRKVLDINLTGSFLTSKAIAKTMVTKGKGGKIVLVASLGGVKGMPGSAGYCAAKFGVIGLVKTLALELANYKINVNAISPGTVIINLRDSFHIEKEQAEGLTIDEAIRKDYQKLTEGIPLGRVGTTEEIADLALFLVSDQSKYITGEAINITGGVS